MTDVEEKLTESGISIRSQSARFRVSGTGRGRGIVLLYPDKLAAVNSSAQLWGIFLGPLFSLPFPTFFSMTSGNWDQRSESWRAAGSEKASANGWRPRGWQPTATALSSSRST